MINPDAPQPTLPLVWSRSIAQRCPERSGQSVPFDPLADEYRGVAGIVSDVDEAGVSWLRASLARTDHMARIILAVYPGCPTKETQLSQLHDLQSQQEYRIQFRILPMTCMVGAPANCLVAIPKDQSNLVLLFGSTPNFGLLQPDHTHLNMAFRADQSLSNAWIHWLDVTWEQAAPLNGLTVDIPSLSLAQGSGDAVAHWEAYCDLCLQSDSKISITRFGRKQGNSYGSDGDSTESSQDADLGKKRRSKLSDIINIHTLDHISNRVTRLLSEGMQVAVVRDRAVAPLDVPINPKLFDQNAAYRDGNVVHRQSFRISALSKTELRIMEQYRKASRTIINKLGLSLETGLYWMPNNVIELYKREAQFTEKKAQNELTKLVGPTAKSFVESKREEIKQNLQKTYDRVGRHGSPSEDAVEELLVEIEERINNALNSSILAPVTYSGITFDLRESNDTLEAPWAQVEKLICNLARFPREALCNSKGLLELNSLSLSEILAAMNIADDNILRSANGNFTDAIDRSSQDLQVIERIAQANISEQHRCQAYFMVIDGHLYESINQFIDKLRSIDQKT